LKDGCDLWGVKKIINGRSQTKDCDSIDSKLKSYESELMERISTFGVQTK
jgi:hypothetical protein